MIKMMLGVSRRAGMTRPEFHNYLRNTHGPLVLSVPEFLRHLRKYVQNHALMDADGSPSAAVPAVASERDAVIELWYDDVVEIERGLNEPRYLEMIRPDEGKFADFQDFFVLLAEEVWISPLRDSAARIKVFSFLKRRPGLPQDEFLKYWRQTHAPLVTSGSAFKQHVKGYVQNHVLPGNPVGAGSSELFDGVAEMWFDDVQGVARFYDSPEVLTKNSADKAAFVNRSQRLAVLTEELTVYDTIRT